MNEEAGKRRRVADTVVKILTPYYQSKRITSKVGDFREVGKVEEGRLRREGGRRDKRGEEWGGGGGWKLPLQVFVYIEATTYQFQIPP